MSDLLPCPCDCKCPPAVKSSAVLQEDIIEGDVGDIASGRAKIGWRVVCKCGMSGPWGGNGGQYEAKRLYNSIPRRK